MNEQLWKYQNNGGIHMQITDVRVRKVTKEGKMKAVVSITIDNEFVVHYRWGERPVYRNAKP